ncbi:MAG: DUF4209 domain-containing protein [Chloroflexi bacterium]|nr:DUF4209 domain-containing protein [Chloroflexota bacterium]
MLNDIIEVHHALLELPIEGALVFSESRECHSYSKAFRERAQECERDDQSVYSRAWSLLECITDIMFHPGDKAEPFRPMAQWENNRTMVPADLRGEPANTIFEIGMQIQDPELRARLLDVAWEANHNHTAAETAIPAYLESARNLFDPDKWPPCAERFERALRLATILRKSDLRDTIVAEIEDAVLRLDGRDPLFLTVKLVSLLLEYGSSDIQSLADLSDKAATIALDSSGFEQTRRHLENLGACYHRLKDIEGERLAKARIANCFEVQGTMYMEAGEGLVASHWFQMAYTTYRETPGMREKADEVYASLRTAQRQAADSMEVLETNPIDVTEQVENARAAVSGCDFLKALLRLFAIVRPIDFDEAQRATAEGLEETPLIRLASGVTVDSDGRTIAHNTPMNIGEPNDNGAELWEHTARNVGLELHVRGHAIIQPAIEQLALEHAPTFRDVDRIVGNSPLVPAGHEELFARGLLAGLRGDMVQALSELVPQFENGLRCLLSNNGIEISSMDKMRVQDVRMMGGILSQSELGDILGSPDVVKEMKVLFTDDHGLKLRDRLSHGLMSSADFYTGGAYYAWWLICRLCFGPVLVAISRADGE